MFLVDPHGQKFDANDPDTYPWKRCKSGVECLDLLEKGKIKFMVSYGIEISLFLSEKSKCGKLTQDIEHKILQKYLRIQRYSIPVTYPSHGSTGVIEAKNANNSPINYF